MSSAQLSSRMTRTTRPGLVQNVKIWVKRFIGNRVREAGYGLFFASIFLICQSPANSLAIDDIRVLSRLGEPLIAEVIVSPAAGEVINRACFRKLTAAGDMPDVGSVRLTLSRGLDSSILRIAGAQPVREPLSEFMLQVKCPGVPTMVKSFLVMVDPPTMESTAPAAATSAATSAANRAARPAPASSSRPISRPLQNSIQPGGQYRVRTGDTLSTIADRVSGRPDWSVWPIALQIYASNPGAFLLGDPNVIAQGAVIFIPRLADVDMRASTAKIRPGGVTPAARPMPSSTAEPAARIATTTNAAATAPVRQSVPAAAAPAALPAPRIAPAPAIALPVMQLTTGLFRESKMKVQLRAQGTPVAAAVLTPAPVEVPPVSSAPEPQSEPDRPDSVVTANRAVLQPAPAGQSARLNWLWIIVGLLTGLLIGALTAVGLFRHNLRREYEHDLRDGVQRQAHAERMRQQRHLAETSAATGGAVAPAPTMDLSPAADPQPTVEEIPAIDHTVEMKTRDGLDFELSTDDEPAKVGEPETLEMPEMSTDLDLKLPVETGRTGQHEVDFDLLEAAYSEDYQTEFVNAGAKTDESDADKTGDTDRYYHLENRDPTDETPLPIELGEDEMGDDNSTEGDGKVVRFRR